MPLNIVTDPNPLRTDAAGAVRVGKCHVLFELVIGEFKRGRSPEQIVDSFDTLDLADVYSSIAFYLRHREEVEAWLREIDAEAKAIRAKIEASQPHMKGFRERLKKRAERFFGASVLASLNESTMEPDDAHIVDETREE
jgi:hypothetical protein